MCTLQQLNTADVNAAAPLLSELRAVLSRLQAALGPSPTSFSAGKYPSPPPPPPPPTASTAEASGSSLSRTAVVVACSRPGERERAAPPVGTDNCQCDQVEGAGGGAGHVAGLGKCESASLSAGNPEPVGGCVVGCSQGGGKSCESFALPSLPVPDTRTMTEDRHSPGRRGTDSSNNSPFSSDAGVASFDDVEGLLSGNRGLRLTGGFDSNDFHVAGSKSPVDCDLVYLVPDSDQPGPGQQSRCNDTPSPARVDSGAVDQPPAATGLDTVRRTRRRWSAVPAEGLEAVSASLAASVSH
jgi:hypothetical protein